MTWKCTVCPKKYISVYKKRPIDFYSTLPMALPVGNMHSAMRYRVCSESCLEVIRKHERLTNTVWSVVE